MKTMLVLTTRNLRETVKAVNDYNTENPDNPIQREDIVSLIHKDGQYMMVYFN